MILAPEQAALEARALRREILGFRGIMRRSGPIDLSDVTGTRSS